MNRIQVFIPILASIVLSCNSPKMKVDLIVTNAVVYTVNDSFAVAESFAVMNGEFLAVGSNDEIAAKYTSDKIENYEGKVVYPGFNDAHCHFFGYGMNLMQYADLAGVADQESIYLKLQEHQRMVAGSWLGSESVARKGISG